MKMTSSQAATVFGLFLKANHAYKRFMANLNTQKRGITLEHLCKLAGDPEILMYGAFVWKDTAEGFEYWDKLADAWDVVYDSLA